jgi:ADP-dependent NAD(P)H-hydrate dehydratase
VPPADPPPGPTTAVVTPKLLRDWPLPEPGGGGDKHSRGTVLVVGGAEGTPGAVLLCGVAALRAGAGRLQVLTVAANAVALGIALPEALVAGLPADPDGTLSAAAADEVADRAGRAAALVVGPGLRSAEQVEALVEQVLPRLDGTTVLLDALAISAVAGREELLWPLAGRVVLTPNEKELSALLGREAEEGLDAAAEVAERYRAVVKARGGTAAPDGRTWTDGAGDAGLGTSGSGDVLAGLVGGLLARGADPAQAAVWAGHVHAASGDRLAARLGRLGFLARELLDEVPLTLAAYRG